MEVRSLRLPQEYQQVEWISPVADVSTNTRANIIKTGVMISGDVGYDTTYEVLQPAYNYDRYIAVALDTKGPRILTAYTGSGNGSSARNGASIAIDNNTYVTSGILDWGERIRVQANVDGNGSVYVNNVLLGQYGTFTVSTPKELTLFCKDQSYNCCQAYAKMYHFAVYEAGVMVRDMYPCYRKADDVIGMYDVVNNAFYYNAASGEWNKGENI